MSLNVQKFNSRIILGTLPTTEAVVRRCSLKEVFLKSSKSLQENTYVKVSFLIKFTEHLWWLLLPPVELECFSIEADKISQVPRRPAKQACPLFI